MVYDCWCQLVVSGSCGSGVWCVMCGGGGVGGWRGGSGGGSSSGGVWYGVSGSEAAGSQ